jgi:hypothetical protein
MIGANFDGNIMITAILSAGRRGRRGYCRGHGSASRSDDDAGRPGVPR